MTQTNTDREAMLKRFQDWRFGVFFHWGIASGCTTVGAQRLAQERSDHAIGKNWDAQASAFDAQEWVAAVAAAGAQYVCFTVKHQPDFCLFRTRQTDYASGRDYTEEIVSACRRAGLGFIAYMSMAGEDFNQMRGFPTPPPSNQGEGFAQWPARMREHHDRLTAWLEELCEQYSPDGIWLDGWPSMVQAMENADVEPMALFDFEQLAQPVRRILPGCLIGNKRLYGPHTDYLESECLFRTHFGEPLDAFNQPVEVSDTLPGSNWFAKTDTDPGVPDSDEVDAMVQKYLHRLITSVGNGFNYLLDAGPLPNGALQSYEAMILRRIGKWMNDYGNTLRGTRKSRLVPGHWGYAVDQDGKTHLHMIDTTRMLERMPRHKPEEAAYLKQGMPAHGRVELTPVAEEPKAVVHTNSGEHLPFFHRNHALAIDLRQVEADPIDTIITIEWDS